MTPFSLSEVSVVKINEEPSWSVPVKRSPSPSVKGEVKLSIRVPLSEKSLPEKLTVLPLLA